MRSKRLNHYVDVACKMFVGWRMGDDLEILSELPDGTITIDLLTGEATHSIEGPVQLHIAKEIQAWLQQQSKKENVDITKIEAGALDVDIDTGTIPTNKEKVVFFNFECRSFIKTNKATYQASLKNIGQWHTRLTT